MDTTPQFKKQCKEGFKDIGFVFNEGPDNLLIVDDDELLSSLARKKEGIEWAHGMMFTIHGQLYRQDQLQEICAFSNIWNMSARFHVFLMGSQLQSNVSPEMGWLAFVMDLFYQKTWNSDKEQWVKEG